jgi:hypothetical protein
VLGRSVRYMSVWVRHLGMAHRVADGADGRQIRRTDVNILNESRTADKGGP